MAGFSCEFNLFIICKECGEQALRISLWHWISDSSCGFVIITWLVIQTKYCENDESFFVSTLKKQEKKDIYRKVISKIGYFSLWI